MEPLRRTAYGAGDPKIYHLSFGSAAFLEKSTVEDFRAAMLAPTLEGGVVSPLKRPLIDQHVFNPKFARTPLH